MNGDSINRYQIIAQSSVMKRVIELIDRVALSDCPVLIEGDSGTGKELLARRIHQCSPRSKSAFIPVNCVGINPGVFESQLFGHVRGSFTGAEQTTLGLVRCADKGTLFLDEIGEMSLDMQPKLLRVIQEGEVMPVGNASLIKVNVRFVVATNRNTHEEMRKGKFREDLYYRLNVVHVYIPPLRSRREDIVALLDHFLKVFAERYGQPVVELSSRVHNQLMRYAWPGNVRELAAWVERLYVIGVPPEVLATALELEAPAANKQFELSGIRTASSEDERHMILRALDAAGNNRTKAAKLLKIHRGTLLRKIQQYDITTTDS